MTGDVNTQGCLRYVRLVQPSACDCRLLLPTSRSAPVSRLLGCPRYQEAQQQVVDTLPSCWYWAWACTCHLSAWAWAEFGERRAPRAASATCRPVPAEAHVERRLTRSLLQQWRHTTARAGERGNPWLWTGVHVVRVSLHLNQWWMWTCTRCRLLSAGTASRAGAHRSCGLPAHGPLGGEHARARGRAKMCSIADHRPTDLLTAQPLLVFTR